METKKEIVDTKKHLDLDNAILELNSLKTLSIELLHEINGEETLACEVEERKEPTLLEILNDGPERIREYRRDVIQILNSIGKALFEKGGK